MLTAVNHKGLKELFEDGKTAKIDKRLHQRILERLDALDAAKSPEDLNVPGYDFSRLRGLQPGSVFDPRQRTRLSHLRV